MWCQIMCQYLLLYFTVNRKCACLCNEHQSIKTNANRFNVKGCLWWHIAATYILKH